MFIAVDGETAVIQFSRGRQIFRSVSVRPDLGTPHAPDSSERESDNCERDFQGQPDDLDTAFVVEDGEYLCAMPRKVQVNARSKEELLPAEPRCAYLATQ